MKYVGVIIGCNYILRHSQYSGIVFIEGNNSYFTSVDNVKIYHGHKLNKSCTYSGPISVFIEIIAAY